MWIFSTGIIPYENIHFNTSVKKIGKMRGVRCINDILRI